MGTHQGRGQAGLGKDQACLGRPWAGHGSKIVNTTRQASGTEAVPPRRVPTYEDAEPAYRYGFGARSKYGAEYPEWGDELETQLKSEWEVIAPARRQTWMQDRAIIRRGWEYKEEDVAETADK